MKIWVIPSWYPPNGGYFFQEHSQAISEYGADVTVLASINTSLKKFPLLKPLAAVSTIEKTNGRFSEKICNYWNIPLFERPNAYEWIKATLSFIENQIKKHGKPHIIQAHSSLWAGVVGARISRRHAIPYVITEHRSRFVYSTTESKAMFRPWYDPLLGEAFTGASAIITVSKALNEKILNYAPHKKDLIWSVPNMVDVDFFSPPADTTEKPGKIFTFFALANHIPLKGFDTLLDAFAIVNQETGVSARLVIGGDGPESTSLKEKCSGLGLDQTVCFTGALNRQQVKQNMQQADAFVLPSRFEAFGVVFIEAMSCGIPVIAARAGGPETFVGPDTGMLVEHSNPRELSLAMLNMISGYKNYPRQVIRNYAVDNFSKKAVAKRYIEIYNEVLNKIHK